MYFATGIQGITEALENIPLCASVPSVVNILRFRKSL